jgi:heterogeneous nuclear ribonucleoprotein F/H
MQYMPCKWSMRPKIGSLRPVQALSKNGDFMGERYVRLLHVPVTEMEEQVRLGTLAIPGNAAKLRNRMAQQQRTRRGFPSQLVPTVVPSALYTVAQRPMYQQGLPMW